MAGERYETSIVSLDGSENVWRRAHGRKLRADEREFRRYSENRDAGIKPLKRSKIKEIKKD